MPPGRQVPASTALAPSGEEESSASKNSSVVWSWGEEDISVKGKTVSLKVTW
jgi:hypothetical protein